MKKIKLTQNKFALVDNADYEWLSRWKWYAQKNHCGHIAVRNCQCPFGEINIIRMSRQIMSCPQDKEVDHQDHNILNNQRFNLRICTHIENQRNRSKNKNNNSGFKGIGWHKIGKKWQARIGFNSQRIYLGLFDSKIEAAKVYDKKAKELFGEFAHTNF